MGTENITMPQLGESVTEGTISSWLVKEGDKVTKYDPIAEVLTDKVNAEVPSSFSGIIKELVAKEGETISVGEIMCTMETEEKGIDQKEATIEPPRNNSDFNKSDETSKKRYSPAVLRLAQENDIELTQINGTGKGGRITRKDVERVISSKPSVSKDVPNQQSSPSISNPKPHRTVSDESPDTSINTGDMEIPVTGVRKAIAENMVISKQEIPHAWMTVEADVTDLVSYRNLVKNEFIHSEGFNLTYFAFFIKAVAQALKKFPELNSTWQHDKIIQRKAINLSIAVAVEDKLFVPVIKNADEKTIKGIAREVYELSEKAKNHKLTTEDMQGGTFTVNNTGTFGSIHSMGIINHPQAAILQVESIVKRPVIIDNMFAARDMVNLSLSLDHRVLDGLVCGRFLAYLKEKLENMNETSIQMF
ncbi:dihydrolipoamide acetyltransferase family protein [Oceanobacillus halophilus]|uniref:Dihydrolipoamide acetyltransferase component of pyruvate dehydrogenase complex n=1 Tax=Oceanobacillus halophilus TaxID=930130 RepID=A0A495ACP4_9BACI|nr:dihydrolipoamide acetyltransferase family protein [Oceanobacillus halophilus]RKQ37736.1 2-oxo acid dehydrogenase subunit E2 [Oceanobacillus halophilus]